MKLTEWEKHNLELTPKQLWIKLNKEVQLYQNDELRKFQERFRRGLEKIMNPYKKIIEMKCRASGKSVPKEKGK